MDADADDNDTARPAGGRGAGGTRREAPDWTLDLDRVADLFAREKPKVGGFVR